MHRADGVNGSEVRQGIEGKDGMAGLVRGQLHRVRLVKAVDLQQQRFVGDAGPVLMQVGHTVEGLCAGEEDQPVEGVLREVRVGDVEGRCQRRVVPGVNRSNGRDVGGSVAVHVHADGGDIVAQSIDERSARAVLLGTEGQGRGIGRQDGLQPSDVREVVRQNVHEMFDDGGIPCTPRNGHGPAFIVRYVDGGQVGKVGLWCWVRN